MSKERDSRLMAFANGIDLAVAIVKEQGGDFVRFAVCDMQELTSLIREKADDSERRLLKEQGDKLRTIAEENAVYWDGIGSKSPGRVHVVFNVKDLLRICDLIDEVCSDE